MGHGVIIAGGGTFTPGNAVSIGYMGGVGSSAVSNHVLVSGAGATWNSGTSEIIIGAEATGSAAIGNWLKVEKGGLLTSGIIKVGVRGSATAGGASTGNRLIVTEGGQVKSSSTMRVGSVSGAAAASNNSILVASGGLVEANTLVVGATGGNTISCSNGGIFQFTTTTPTITSPTPGDISINGGVLAFRNFTTVNVRGNFSGAQLLNMGWSGENAFRLNNAGTSTASSQTYVFDPALGSTNYFRLEMVDGTTRHRGSAGNTLTIGQSVGSGGGGGAMRCSNTTAFVEMPFVLNGDLTLFNSALTLQQTAAINGGVFIDLDNLPPSGTALVAQGALTLGGSSTLHLNGAPVDGKVLMTYSGSLTGRFTVEGLPGNFTLKYDPDGTISILNSPSVILVR